MNLRDFFKQIRSPGGKTALTLAAVVVAVLLILPVLVRDTDGFGAGPERSARDAFEIQGLTREIGVQGVKYNRDDNPGVVEAKPVEEEVPPPPEPVKKLPAPPAGTSFTGNDAGRTAPLAAAPAPVLITAIDGENAASADGVFLSERYAPYGRMISCKMTNTVESGNLDTPLIAVVIEDLWWINQYGEKKLIIPAGTEVHGTVQGAKPLRNRLTTGNDFVLVWQATSDMVGFEMRIQGIALEKSTHQGDKTLATITDMSAGIPGQVVNNENLSKILMYTLAFGQGLAQGYQTTEAYAENGDTVITQEGTTKNALARGGETLAQIMLQDVSEMIARESYYIRIPAGTEFYLFVKQVINLDEASVANTLLNQLETEKISGARPMAGQGSHSEVLNAFSR